MLLDDVAIRCAPPRHARVRGARWAFSDGRRRRRRCDDGGRLGARCERVEHRATQRLGRDALAHRVGGIDGDAEPRGLRGERTRYRRTRRARSRPDRSRRPVRPQAAAGAAGAGVGAGAGSAGCGQLRQLRSALRRKSRSQSRSSSWMCSCWCGFGAVRVQVSGRRSSSAAISAIARSSVPSAVGETGADRELAAIDRGLRSAHGFDGQIRDWRQPERRTRHRDDRHRPGSSSRARCESGSCALPSTFCWPAKTKLQASPACASAPLSST